MEEWDERDRDLALRQLESESEEGSRAPRAVDNQYSFL